MMKLKKAPIELVNFLVEKTKNVQCQYRKMFGYPAYFINGNMFAGIHGDCLFIRLSKSDIERIRSEHGDVSLFEPVHGKIMSDYVVLPRSVYGDGKLFGEWMKKSIDHASSLPPKKKNK
jgi:TfoX/Sxy family transcriptional regulator of competence genes